MKCSSKANYAKRSKQVANDNYNCKKPKRDEMKCSSIHLVQERQQWFHPSKNYARYYLLIPFLVQEVVYNETTPFPPSSPHPLIPQLQFP